MPDPIRLDEAVEHLPSLPYQFHQVAIFQGPTELRRISDLESPVNILGLLGFRGWIEDTADLKGILDGEPVITRAKMLFSYELMPMEFEFLWYDGPSHNRTRWEYESNPFISHLSTYVDDIFEATIEMASIFGAPFHRFITQSHTNPAVVGKKRFIESIFNTRFSLGFDLKLIQKVPWDYNDNDWLAWKI